MNLLEYNEERYREELRQQGYRSRNDGSGVQWQPPGTTIWLTEEEAFKSLLQQKRKERGL